MRSSDRTYAGDRHSKILSPKLLASLRLDSSYVPRICLLSAHTRRRLREKNPLRLRFPTVNLVRATSVKIFEISPGKRDAHTRFVLRLRNHSAHPARPIEHLDAHCARYVVAAQGVGGHPIAGALRLAHRLAQGHVTRAVGEVAVRFDAKDPHVRPSVF